MSKFVFVAWIQSLVATLGSLYLSEVLKFTPCTLCWYQRICMYPITIILLIGLLRKNKEIYLYVLPFSIVGLVVSIYHNLLYYGVFSESAYFCTAGVSCTEKYLGLLGFVTIPFLSLTVFLVITVCMLLIKWRDGR